MHVRSVWLLVGLLCDGTAPLLLQMVGEDAAVYLFPELELVERFRIRVAQIV